MFEYRSKTIAAIGKAIINIRKELGSFIKEGSTDPKDKRYSCVKLETILEKLHPACENQNVLFTQDAEKDENTHDIWLYTRFEHLETGEFISSASFLFNKSSLTANNQQEAGKTQTYQCRQQIRMLLGLICYEQDYDEGEQEEKKTIPKKEFVQQPGCITEDEAKKLYKVLLDYPEAAEVVKKEFNFKNTYYLKEELYASVKRRINELVIAK